MTKLHELTSAYRQIDEIVENPEVSSEQIIDALNSIESGIAIKAENIAKLVENFEVTAEAIKGTEEKLAARRKAIESRVKSIKSYLLVNMIKAGIYKIGCEYFQINVRDNPKSVVIEDEKKIPDEYMRQPETPPKEPDKKKILEDLKEGVVIEGVRIGQGQSLEIR